MVDVGERIRKVRKLAGLTQRELAERIHMSQSYIADMERSRHNPSLSALKLIADALQVDVAEFVGNGVTIQETGMTSDEIDLLMTYRLLSDDNKKFAKTMVYKLVPNKARYSNSPPPIMMKKVRSAQG